MSETIDLAAAFELLTESVELTEPHCEQCGSGEPRWSCVKLCGCPEEWLLCDSCRLSVQLFEARTLLHGGHFECTECAATSDHLHDLVAITPLP